jgi:putative tryptophan/tyrosine transport system substrate-binding protein
MKRRAFLASAAAFLAAPRAAEAQQRTKIPKIGVLAPRSGIGPGLGAFDRGLRDLGWVDGQNVVIERRFAEGRFERFPGLATELVHLQGRCHRCCGRAGVA